MQSHCTSDSYIAAVVLVVVAVVVVIVVVVVVVVVEVRTSGVANTVCVFFLPMNAFIGHTPLGLLRKPTTLLCITTTNNHSNSTDF